MPPKKNLYEATLKMPPKKAKTEVNSKELLAAPRAREEKQNNNSRIFRWQLWEHKIKSDLPLLPKSRQCCHLVALQGKHHRDDILLFLTFSIVRSPSPASPLLAKQTWAFGTNMLGMLQLSPSSPSSWPWQANTMATMANHNKWLIMVDISYNYFDLWSLTFKSITCS